MLRKRKQKAVSQETMRDSKPISPTDEDAVSSSRKERIERACFDPRSSLLDFLISVVVVVLYARNGIFFDRQVDKHSEF